MKRILRKTRLALGKKLYPLTNVFYDFIPLDKVSEILAEAGVVLLQEDNTEWSGFLCGRDSRAVFTLGDIATKDDRGMYQPIKDCLYFSWYKHETGRYEINMYFC